MAAETDPAYEDDGFETAADGNGAGARHPVAAGDAAARLSDLVAYLARNLVDDPEAVEVDAQQRGGSVFVTLRVPEAELGKVIGRQGRIARAMRTVVMVAGTRHNVRASLDIDS
jgi:predicted RNA-binding protein YlqC (UPF0109 family)